MEITKYIQTPLEDLIPLLILNGEVISNKSAAARKLGIASSTFYRWANNKDYDKLEDAGVEVHFAAPVSGGYLICTDGELRQAIGKNRKIKKIGKSKNLVRLYIEGEILLVGVANLAYKKFVDSKHIVFDIYTEEGIIKKEKLYFVDGDISNCSIDNLTGFDQSKSKSGNKKSLNGNKKSLNGNK